MKRLAFVMLAAVLVMTPALASAQDYRMDSQHPNEYNDEDSQPLKLVSYVLAPVGFVLEWTIARPLHYLANDTPLAPVLGANTASEDLTPPNVQPLPPPDVITEHEHHIDTTIVPAPESESGYQKSPPSGQAPSVITPPSSQSSTQK